MKIYFVIFFVYNNEQILSQEYSYIGCYKNLNHHDLLQGSNYTNQHMMSARICVDVCRKKNFQYAGTEFGYKCFCGNEINPRYNTVNNNIVNHDQCDIRCAGNGSEICGGNIRISVYRINKSFTTIKRLPVTTTTQNTNVQQKPTHGIQNRYSHPPVVMSKTISPYFVSSGAPSKTVSTVTMGSITSDTAVKSTHFIPQNTHVGSSSVGDIHTSWFNISERGKYTPPKSVETTKHTLNENTTIFKSLNTTNSTRGTTDSIDTISSAYTGISDAFNTSESAPKSNCECHCKQISKWDSILNSNISKAEIDRLIVNEVQRIKTELTVNKSTLSFTRRRRSCARDDRRSSATLGFMGMAVIISFLSFFLVFDTLLFYHRFDLRNDY